MLMLAAFWMTSSYLAGSNSEANAMAGPVPQEPVVVIRCPPLKRYTADQSKAAGLARKTLRTSNPGSILLTMNDDYFALREACRAIGQGAPR
jgi:hypothetical protein